MRYKKKLVEKQQAEFDALKAARLQEIDEAKAGFSSNPQPMEKRNGFASLPQNGHQNGFAIKAHHDVPVTGMPHVNNIFLAKLHIFLDEHLDDPQLKIETVAAAMAMSKSTLNRKLGTLRHIPANKFTKGYRLRKATACFGGFP